MKTTATKKLVVHPEWYEESTKPAVDRQDEVARLSSGPLDDMAEDEKPREEPKKDSGKPLKNGGYTIPVQMY